MKILKARLKRNGWQPNKQKNSFMKKISPTSIINFNDKWIELRNYGVSDPEGELICRFNNKYIPNLGIIESIFNIKRRIDKQ